MVLYGNKTAEKKGRPRKSPDASEHLINLAVPGKDGTRWPRMKFSQFGSLEYLIPQFDPEWCQYMARKIISDEPLNAAVRHIIGECLLKLGETPRALDELNHHLDRAPESIRALNIAIHYLALRELLGKGKSSQARGRVADAWSIKDATVKKAVTAQTSAHQEYGRLISFGLRQHRARALATTRAEIIEMIQLDMCDRAILPWFSHRKAPGLRK
jgi:hypothetical protein